MSSRGRASHRANADAVHAGIVLCPAPSSVRPSIPPSAHRPEPPISRARTVLGALVAISALTFVACDAPTDVDSVRVLSAELTTPAPLVRTLRVALDRPAELTVEYWTDGDSRLRVQAPASASPSITLTRLRPRRSYHFQVVGTTLTGDFTSDTVPTDLAASLVSTTGRHTAPLVMLHLFEPTGFKGYAMLDEHDDVVWYWRTTDFPFGMARRTNGNFVLMDKGRGLVEVGPDGVVAHELPQDFANREMHHDAVASRSNTVFFIAFDDRTVNGAKVRGEAIWEWSPETGALDKRWTTWDHFSLAATPAPRADREWAHANALAIGPRNNVLVSMHHWNQVVSITSDWSTIEWRLGGMNATYPLPAADAFSGQHTAREISPGHVVLFDNGAERGGFSRAIEYSLDGGTARVQWEWRAQPINFAPFLGSARRLANGNTMIAFGVMAGLSGSSGPTEVYEVDAAGTPVWHLVTRTFNMYRAEPQTSIGAESVVP
ncbi:MAG: hypothetical protein DMD35_19470 [Gemmatimonadetes bacterium]|nr:MAG: hypothetical protein DMD35_19470 [Gemmatimonadota bacterium]